MKTGIAHSIVLAAAAAMTLGATSTSAAEVNQGSGYLRNVYTSQCLTDRGIENYPNVQECAFDAAGNVPPNQQWTRIPAIAGNRDWALLRSGLGNCLRHGTEAEHSPESTVCTNTGPVRDPDFRQAWHLRLDPGSQGATVRYQTQSDHRILCLGVDKDAPHLVMMAEQSRWPDRRYIEWKFG